MQKPLLHLPAPAGRTPAAPALTFNLGVNSPREERSMIDVIIIDHEDRPGDPKAWVNPIQASTDNVRSLTVINARTGSTETYRDDT